ncbi:MAG TPA: hypothetical protein VH328_08640 [Burkholderiaceae bacterium]|nr:hypothetical protein [Burkholderiaceae bacterium]
MPSPAHLVRALVARLHSMDARAAAKPPRLHASTPRHVTPGFGTLVIGNSQRDEHLGR